MGRWLTLDAMTAELPTADPAQLRERLKIRIEHMTLPQLRELAARIAPPIELEDWEREHLRRAPEGAEVIRYPGGKIRLTTDPADMPPYGPPETAEEFAAALREARAAIDRGEFVTWEQMQAQMLNRRS